MLGSLLTVFSAFIFAYAADLSAEYAHHAVLDPKGLMKLHWTVHWDIESVSFAVEAATTGWIGFGFSSGNGKMVGSDVVMGYVKESKGYLTDRYADFERLPVEDEEQNYFLTGFEESDQKTILKFTRKFDTCDSRDRRIKEGTTKVVYAFHTEDPTSENGFKYHTFRGSRSILLLNNVDKKEIDETGWESFVFHNRNITIPKKDTTYWCSLFKAPEINSKKHITKFEPYVQPGNEGLVHHLMVYECHGNFNDSHFKAGYNCRDQANMPLGKCYFNNIVAAWGFGGEAFYYPPKAGFPIGTADSPKFYMMEIHYDNPERIEGRNDSSGMRFHYTSNIRMYDAGTLSVGDLSSNFLVIPPKQESWLSVGFCPKECNLEPMIASKLPEGGINVFAAFLHTHLQGVATWTKHFRSGVELPEIARDDNYDFNFQDIQVLKKEVNIQPGDDMVHFCKYQTMDRHDLVVGGDSTSNEMCMDFMFYYPQMINASNFCYSILHEPVFFFVKKHFPAVNVSWPNPLADMNVTWTKDLVADLRTRMDNTKTIVPICFQPGKSLPEWLPIPRMTKLLPPAESSCRKSVNPESSSSVMSASPLFVLSLFYLPVLIF
ncbi:DBH-like monooxygenase protein 1 isoform X1 [Montipora capricornis]|uniref:DBH-like monooxygenase protein 1 isoform X1 n=2 Tax=Montipora capricornis TaxID=246305 RepID=UPI0035F1003F